MEDERASSFSTPRTEKEDQEKTQGFYRLPMSGRKEWRNGGSQSSTKKNGNPNRNRKFRSEKRFPTVTNQICHRTMKLTSRQRIQTAMNLQKPDRVPLMCQFSIGSMMMQLKPDPVEFWYNEDTFADGLVSLCRQFRFDGILVSLLLNIPPGVMKMK